MPGASQMKGVVTTVVGRWIRLSSALLCWLGSSECLVHTSCSTKRHLCIVWDWSRLLSLFSLRQCVALTYRHFLKFMALSLGGCFIWFTKYFLALTLQWRSFIPRRCFSQGYTCHDLWPEQIIKYIKPHMMGPIKLFLDNFAPKLNWLCFSMSVFDK